MRVVDHPAAGGVSAVPFHAMISLLIVGGVEELAIALLVPAHQGEMPTVWHAWKLRREAARSAAG